MKLPVLIIAHVVCINCLIVNSFNKISSESFSCSRQFFHVKNWKSGSYKNSCNTHIYLHMNKNKNDFGNDIKMKLSQPSQVLSFIEPLSGVTVTIIGSMHYNPQSIQLAEQTIEKSALRNKLGAVVIESCNTRWKKMVASAASSNNSKHSLQNSTLDTIVFNSTMHSNLHEHRSLNFGTTTTNMRTSPSQTFSSASISPSSSSLLINNLRRLLKNEMKASHDMANKYSVPTVLGDQDINQTGVKAKEIVMRTFQDLIRPFNGGWQRIYQDIVNDFQSSYPSESSSRISRSNSYVYSTAAGVSSHSNNMNKNQIMTTPTDNNNIITTTATTSNNSYLSMLDILLDYRLLLGTPKALLSYMTALILKSPLVGGFLLLLLLLSTGFDDGSAAISSAMDISSSSNGGGSEEVVMNWSSYLSLLSNPLLLSDYMDKSLYSSMDIMDSSILGQLLLDFAGSFVFTALEIVFFSRIFLSALLTDRNQVLAENIRNTCLYLAATTHNNHNDKSNNGNVNSSSDISKNSSSKEVIVVLGMAHCNGVRYLLENHPNSDDNNNNYNNNSSKEKSSEGGQQRSSYDVHLKKSISELSKQIESIAINFPRQ